MFYHSLPYEYSEKEIAMFTNLDLGFILENPSMPPVAVYTTATYSAFMKYDNLDKKIIESLRRCIKAIEDQKINRLTKEFDDLIEL